MSEQEWVETECPACDGGGRGYTQVSKPRVEAVPPIIERLDALRDETLKNKAAHHNGAPIKHWEESGEQLKRTLIQAYPELRTLLLDALRENERYRKALERISNVLMHEEDMLRIAREALGGNDAASE